MKDAAKSKSNAATRRKNAKRGAPAGNSKKQLEELYVKAQIAIMSDQYEQADGFFQAIVSLAPRYVVVAVVKGSGGGWLSVPPPPHPRLTPILTTPTCQRQQ